MNTAARTKREIAAYERDFGHGIDRLPWSGPDVAARTLSRGSQQRLLAFRRAVRDAWLSSRPEMAVAAAFAELNPSANRIAFYPCAPDGGPAWFVSGSRGAVSTAPIAMHDALPRIRGYALRQRTRFADTPVALAPLMRIIQRTDGLEDVLEPNDIVQQVRMVLYVNGEAKLFAGVYRGRRAPRFTEEDHALLFAARPTFRTWHRVTRAIGLAPLGDGALAASLEAFAAPALLVRHHRVVFANRAGVPLVSTARDWLAAGRPSGFGTTTRLSPGGVAMDLVLPVVTPAAADARFQALPPSLQRVAQRLARGESDKDIAHELGLSLASARTYVTRVLERMGVHNRRELMTLTNVASDAGRTSADARLRPR